MWISEKVKYMPNSIYHWIKDHDERWSFILLYVGGSVFLSIFLNLFWVVLLMALNLSLKVVRNLLIKLPMPLAHALWQIKLDVALIMLSLLFILYGDQLFAALGLAQVTRTGQVVRGAQMATRAGAIQRGIRVLMMTMDDMTRIARILIKSFFRPQGSRVTSTGHELEEAFMEDAGDTTPWKNPERGDVFSLAFGGLCILLIVMSPVLTHKSITDIGAQLFKAVNP